MKRRLLLVFLVLSLVTLTFAGCDVLAGIGFGGGSEDHEHKGGTATCVSRAICDECRGAYGELTEHSFKEATCQAPEVCSVCRATRGEASDHDYKPATCTSGSECRFCGKTANDALGHDFSTTLSYDSTSHWYACTRCDAKNEKTNHKGGGATCKDSEVCDECGVSFGQPDKTKHIYSAVVTLPTCTDKGYTTHTCSVCADVYIDSEVDALGHKGGTPTCNDKAICTNCNEPYGEALGHIFGSNTCVSASTCTRCGEMSGEPKGHSFDNELHYGEAGHWNVCTVCGESGNFTDHEGGTATDTSRAICEVCGEYYGVVSLGWVTEAVFPEDNGEFIIANRLIREWYSTYDFRTTDTDKYWLEEDIFMPEVPVLKWSVGAPAHYHKLYISSSANMSGAVCYLTNATELTVEHLMASTVYYWYVDSIYSGFTVRSDVFTFSTASTPRTVDIEGVSNARDIGGYITVDGFRIKQGMIYRTAKLDDITELGMYTLVNILGVKTDLDLRGDKAVAVVPGLNHIATACPWYSTGSNHIWMNDYNKSEFARTVKVFADPDNYPIVFHCSLGRDRTGTLAMVLGGLLGLDENTLMMEYELSVFSYWGTNGGTKYNNGLRKNIHDTYVYIDTHYEGSNFAERCESFLIEIGVTAEEIASIRSIMLEEVV